jgi:hypothetical protein
MDKPMMTMLPLNLNENEVNSRRGIRDRERIGASLADIDSMEFDKSITFGSALRRSGRFDRELLFTSAEACHDILRNHTVKWTPPRTRRF